MDHPLRVLIVDDTVTYRKIVTEVLAGCPDVEVVGTAANGKIALQRLDQQAADLLVLDLEMPEMNGQAVLEELRRRNSPVGRDHAECLDLARGQGHARGAGDRGF